MIVMMTIKNDDDDDGGGDGDGDKWLVQVWS